MGSELDLDDVVAGHPLATLELTTLRKEVDAWRANARDSGVESRAFKIELDAAISRIERLGRALATTQEDAERYRWLRENANYAFDEHNKLPQLVYDSIHGDWRHDLDNAIDTARGKG